MKNHFEKRGKAGRIVFDPSTDQFVVEALVHPFLKSSEEPSVVKTASVTKLSDKRRPKSKPATKSLKQRLA